MPWDQTVGAPVRVVTHSYGFAVICYFKGDSSSLSVHSKRDTRPICKMELEKETHTDHNHAIGKVRGILCPGCNKSFSLDVLSCCRGSYGNLGMGEKTLGNLGQGTRHAVIG